MVASVRRPLLVVAAAVSAAVFAVGLPPEAHFLVYGLAGSALIALTWSPRVSTAIILVSGALVLLPFHVAPRETFARFWAVEPGFPLAYLGLAAIVYLSVRALRNDVPRNVLYGAAGIPAFIALTEPFHALVIRATPVTVDPVLQRLDVALFGEATFAAGRLLATHPWFEVITVWCYVALALVAAGVYALALRRRAGDVPPAELLWQWALAGMIGAVCFLLVPAVGPRWVFSEWPWRLPDLTMDHSVPSAAVPRNAMPSLHATWAILVCWGARGVPRALWLFLAPWVILMLMATLGAGGHYLIDLVAAIPVAALAAVLGAAAARRKQTATTGG